MTKEMSLIDLIVAEGGHVVTTEIHTNSGEFICFASEVENKCPNWTASDFKLFPTVESGNWVAVLKKGKVLDPAIRVGE